MAADGHDMLIDMFVGWLFGMSIGCLIDFACDLYCLIVYSGITSQPAVFDTHPTRGVWCSCGEFLLVV